MGGAENLPWVADGGMLTLVVDSTLKHCRPETITKSTVPKQKTLLFLFWALS